MPERVEQMAERAQWMAEEHTGTAETHHFPYSIPSFRLIAVDHTRGTEPSVFLCGTVLQLLHRICIQITALITKQTGRMMMVPAVQGDHVRENLLSMLQRA